VNHGANGTEVTAIPDAGYHFAQWSDGVLTPARTDLNVTADITVTAQFAINQYTLTYTAGTGGSISGASPQTVNHGANGAAVTAVPDTGYHFVKWSDDSTANPRTDANVTADVAVTAEFAVNTYTLTYTAGAGGSISGSSPQTVNHGANGTEVTAIPDAGYRFVQWSDGVMTAPRTDVNVTANLTVTALFAPTRHELAVLSAHGAPVPPVGLHTNDYGTRLTNRVALTDTLGTTQYVATGWALANHADINGFTVGVTTSMVMVVTNDATLTWSWKTQYWLDTAVSGNGMVSVADGWQDAGASVTITASPHPADSFLGWIGDVDMIVSGSAASPSITIEMVRTAALTATFTSISPPNASTVIRFR
jgi:hypothetical protein